MRGFNNKIKSVYQELTNSKEKFGSFHKTLIHLHTPVSYDYKLFSNWTATKYRKITEDELYDIFFENKKIKVDKTIFFSNFDKVVFSSSKEYISFLMLAEAIIKNGIEIVVVTDHNTTKGIKKLQMAVSIIMKNYPIYDIHPHILHGVEISAADKLHIVCIYDYEQESWVNQWLSENIISEKDGSYQHSLTIMKDFNNQKIVNYIAHFNSYDILKKGSHLLGAYKRKIFSKENTRFLEFNINSKESSQQLDILYKEVGVLSLGQKVVAMLDFLLAYSDYSKDFRPLIIDQPEDNLDNRYIYRHLVQQFRDVKAQRQIILATHNTTIVTNSMTDQVVIMESDGVNGWIESQGYVSEKYIKNHIINQLEEISVMEMERRSEQLNEYLSN